MQFVLCHLDNNGPVISTLGTELRDMLDRFELQIYRVRSASDFEQVQHALAEIIACMTKLRRTDTDFLRFLGGLVLIFTNISYDDTLQHNLCWYDIGDDGQMTVGQKKRDDKTIDQN
jgi:hypothetical protein